MKRLFSVILVFFISLSFVFSISLKDLYPDMEEEKYETLLSGSVINDSTVNGDIRYMVPRGAMITDSAEAVFSYEKGFAVAVAALQPYPEKFNGLSEEEILLLLYNYGQQMSTLEGITYISHRAGDKPKVLFEEASVLLSPDIDDKTEDPWTDVLPEYNDIYVYLKDTSFGKNIYRAEVWTKSDGLSLELRNYDELKFMGIGIVAQNKVTMLLEITLVDEGILVAAVGAVKDKNPTMNILFYKVNLELSFMNRITALKDWYLEKLN